MTANRRCPQLDRMRHLRICTERRTALMTPPATTATVTVTPAWINTWFHALFTEPGIEFDGQSHQLRWGTNAVDIPESTERIGVYFHYRGLPNQRLALTEKLLGQPVGSHVVARLGVWNSAKFKILEP